MDAYTHATLTEAAQRLETGEWTSAGVCRACLERIRELDREGPALRAVIELNPDAMAAAAARDEAFARGEARGPLHGVPVLIKDSIDTADRTQTTGGSLAMEGNFAPEDAAVVARLRAAGAVILGKTNMSEWGYLRSSRPCSGWSSRGGQTRNPYVLDRTPCGSSSGSAAAVAAHYVPLALGAEVDGSVVHPSSMNSLVGLKPTVGLVSRRGVMGIARQQDTAGTMTRTVADAALALNVLAGEDPGDPATAASQGHVPADYRGFLEAGRLEGVRLGVARAYFGFHEGTDAVVNHALGVLRGLGAELVELPDFDPVPFFGEQEMILFKYGLKASLNAYLASHPKAPVRTMEELIEANRAQAGRILPFFGQEVFEEAVKLGDLDTPEHREAEAACRRMAREEGLDPALREHRLDAIVAPTDGTPPYAIDPVIGDNLHGGCSSVAAMAGYPHLTVPAGYVHGELPVGLSLIGGDWQEPKLLRLGHAFETAHPVRHAPTFLSTIPLA
ncbi:MAG: amidase [Verrucomicrobiota bacterium]